MTKFQNPSFSVGPKAGEKITDEQWAVATGQRKPTGHRSWKEIRPTYEELTMDSEFAEGMFDGGSSSNPGPGAWAFALHYSADNTDVALTGAIEGDTTNNIAEYLGLINLMEYALAHNVKFLTVRGDSMLVIEQVKGNWKVKADHLKPLAEQAKALAKKFTRIELIHVPREENDECDALVKGTIKEHRP